MTITDQDHANFLQQAVDESRRSVEIGGFPVGVLIVREGKIIARGISNGKALHDPTSHAEIDAIRKACSTLSTRSLKDCVLYSSMAPCPMCMSACTWASIPTIWFAIGREKLDPQHFEGEHDSTMINMNYRKPIQLVHYEPLEASALRIVTDWETS